MFEVDGFRLQKFPDLLRIVVAVDPPASSGGDSALAGIVVCGLGVDQRGYVLEDCSGRMSPGEWGARAVQAYEDWALIASSRRAIKAARWSPIRSGPYEPICL
jgi:phage terminase large subunit-like protein